MPAFAIAHLRPAELHEEVLEYIKRIQATLDPYQGRFRVHGATVEVVEGQWPGTIVIIEFPDLDSARDWYASPAYREILPLRARHIDGDLILVDGVDAGYVAADTAAHLRRSVVG